MVQSVGAIGGICNRIDPEYMQIIIELQKLGLSPTNNKAVDKARLNEEKQKLVKKIHEKIEAAQQSQNTNATAERAKMEEQRLGAMKVGELNKILLGL